jgi:hypothetical protein
VATESGLAFARTASINADPVVMAALAERVRHAVTAMPADTHAAPPGP